MYSTTFAVETQVKAGTITSSPGLRPRIATARCSAVVQEVVATACSAPVYSPKRRSNSWTFGPWTTQPRLERPEHGLALGLADQGLGDRDPQSAGELVA